MVAHGGQTVAPVLVELAFAGRRILAKVNVSETKVDEGPILPPEAVMVESDKVNGQDLRELDDVKLFDAIALAATTRTSVRDNFRLKVLLNALIQGELMPFPRRKLQSQLKERLVLYGRPRTQRV